MKKLTLTSLAIWSLLFQGVLYASVLNSNRDGVAMTFSSSKYKTSLKKVSSKSVKEAFLTVETMDKTEVDTVPVLEELEKSISPVVKKCSRSPFLSYKRCRELRMKQGLIIARKEEWLDDVSLLILDKSVVSYTEKEDVLSLKNYLFSLRSLNRLRSRNLEIYGYKDEPHTTLSSKKMRKNVIGLKNMTARQRLYLNFNTIQIKKMAAVMEETINTMNAAVGELRFDYEGDGNFDRSIILSFTEKYRAGIKIFLRDYHRLVNSSYFKERRPLVIDFITAALETGVISNKMLETLLDVAQLGLKNKSFWERHKEVIKGLLRFGVTLIPGVGPYLILPMVLTEAIIEGRDGYQTPNHDHIF